MKNDAIMKFNRLIDATAFSPLSFGDSSAWVGHLPFAAWVIRETSPRIFVELGTHFGTSYFSFCQAVKAHQLNTKCYAVDTWQGDEHAGIYGEEVFQKVAAHQAEHYAEFSSLLRMKFDEALSYFSDGSVDLLHIDGFHTYEAVKHDFETWLPKLSDGAIVLFHDISVREKGFGVWRYWDELKEKYPVHFEFDHCYGLGILQVGEKNSFLNKTWLSDQAQPDLKRFFSALGQIHLDKYASVVNVQTLQMQLQVKDQQINDLTVILQDKEQQFTHQASLVKKYEINIANLNHVINDIYASNSWRICGPLRGLRNILKKLKTI
ncbi:MAG: class I SAM-dependent methyltransferase [Legionellales bacterium]|jgi:hypothetical protein